MPVRALFRSLCDWFRTPVLRGRFVPPLGLLLVLAGCTSSGFITDTGATSGQQARRSVPAAEQSGQGAIRVGLLLSDEVGNLSDGAVDSAYLAGKMAAGALKQEKLTLLIRRHDGSEAALRTAAADFAKAGAALAIGPDDGRAALMLAELLGGKVPVLSLGGGANAGRQVYDAGDGLATEAALSAGEMKRRGYRSVVVVAIGSPASRRHSAAMVQATRAAGITVIEADFTDPAKGLAGLSGLVDAGTPPPDAFVFATGPLLAADAIARIGQNPRFAEAAIVGNAGWGVGDRSRIGGPYWYPALAGSGLVGFEQKFVAAFGQRPTLRAAIVYDLVIMAGALPQVVDEEPFAADVLTNVQGFTGATGGFKFGADGVVQRRFVIVNSR